MEIIHKTIVIPDDHKVVVTFPKSVPPGEVEIILIINTHSHSVPISHATSSHTNTGVSHSASYNSSTLRDAALSKLASLFDENEKELRDDEDEVNFNLESKNPTSGKID